MQSLRARLLVPAAALGAVAVLVVAACSGGSGSNTGDNSLNTELAASIQKQLSAGTGQQTGILVDGSGSVTVTPDLAILYLGVEVQADKVAPARDRAAVAMDAVIKALKDNGVADRDIQTTQFSIQPVYSNQPRTVEYQAPVIVGYRVSNSLTVKVRDLGKVGKVIDDATVAGGDAIRFNGLSFTMDNPKPLEDQARDLAYQNAIAKAQQAARATGVTLGKPTMISVQGGSPIREFAPAAAKLDVSVGTPISTGTMDITAYVTISFAIQ
jgi:uncharacterized protein YggE